MVARCANLVRPSPFSEDRLLGTGWPCPRELAHDILSEGPVDTSIFRGHRTEVAGESRADEQSMARRCFGVGGAGGRRREGDEHPEAREKQSSQPTLHRIPPCCGRATTLRPYLFMDWRVNGLTPCHRLGVE